MSVRTTLTILILALAASACKNEPYETITLAVTTLAHRGANTTNTYTYRNQKLHSFFSMSTDTIAYMRFHYTGDVLTSIVTDSTRYSRKLTSFYYAGDVVVDSTFLHDTTGHHLISARTITYDGDRNPVTVDVITWTDGVLNEQRANLTWEDGNVVHLASFDLSSGEKALLDLSVEYDDRNCIYMKDGNYLFTLPLDELYWLSKNNPITLATAETLKEYTYSYNRLNYPASYWDEKQLIHGVTYKQLR